ncbi:AAA family ATPase [Microbacterium sp. SLBN-146]|uniref:AAA family ATPase n=1 Tax=Microbacterium sp. SLBN-146 TaxID=2768457 RepID=UPI00116F0C67|nr:AAA family ATPase [Microbacterium sp. SLBN-146]TQJ32635.1 putative kinase [Microbacterium sp. SLBN-146]
MLVVISGLPGTGKTAVAAEVARGAVAVHLSIDTVEDALLGAGFPRSWTTGVAAYEAVRAAAEQNLHLRRTVVVDAVNDSEPARDTWRRAAAAAGVPLVFVLLTLDDTEEHRRRLEGRRRNLENVLEPSWDDVGSRRASFEPWPDVHLRVDASESIQHITSVIASQLNAPAEGSSPVDRGR